jgi:uncharacterized membrane protein YjgN (DUF898 family)
MRNVPTVRTMLRMRVLMFIRLLLVMVVVVVMIMVMIMFVLALRFNAGGTRHFGIRFDFTSSTEQSQGSTNH